MPFVSKAIGVPLAKMACRLMLGERLADLDLPADPMRGGHVSVKEAVLPFDRFAGADSLLGPEMRSTGEVMGIARDFPTAFAKAQAAAGSHAARPSGTVFITVTDSDKPAAGGVAAASRPRLPDRRDAGHGAGDPSDGHPRASAQKIGDGSPNVRRRDRARGGRPRRQHADRLRRPHRRLGDPLGPRSRAASRASRR